MLSDLDTPDTTEFLHVFRLAWQETVKDYSARRINGEHGLQASLYRHLLAQLPQRFRVFVEAVVRLGDTGVSDTSKKRVVVDLLIEANCKVVGAIEIKFTPRGQANDLAIRKDLTSLAFLTSRRARADKVTIDMPRYRGTGSEELALTILPQRKLIFAAYCGADASYASEQMFWQEPRRPQSGYWKDRTILPQNFGVALVTTSETFEPEATFFGPPFRRLDGAANVTDANP